MHLLSLHTLHKLDSDAAQGTMHLHQQAHLSARLAGLQPTSASASGELRASVSRPDSGRAEPVAWALPPAEVALTAPALSDRQCEKPAMGLKLPPRCRTGSRTSSSSESLSTARFFLAEPCSMAASGVSSSDELLLSPMWCKVHQLGADLMSWR